MPPPHFVDVTFTDRGRTLERQLINRTERGSCCASGVSQRRRVPAGIMQGGFRSPNMQKKNFRWLLQLSSSDGWRDADAARRRARGRLWRGIAALGRRLWFLHRGVVYFMVRDNMFGNRQRNTRRNARGVFSIGRRRVDGIDGRRRASMGRIRTSRGRSRQRGRQRGHVRTSVRNPSPHFFCESAEPLIHKVTAMWAR